MKFNDAINNNAKAKLVAWINDYTSKKHNKFLVLYGKSGNGKTLFITLLAKEAGMELFTIAPENVTTQEELNTILKSINSSFGQRLVLVDDFDFFKTSIQKKLQEIPSLSNYPVVYTSSTWVYDSKFLKDAVVVKIKKPLTSELTKLLIKMGADVDQAEKIATESKSVRSAILSLQNQTVNELTKEVKTKYKILDDLKSREHQEKVNRQSVKWLFKSIRGYNEDALKVMLEFAEYDYKIMSQFQEIDPFIVNNMLAPIEKVELKQRLKKNDKKASVKFRETKKQDNNFTSIDNFL